MQSISKNAKDPLITLLFFTHPEGIWKLYQKLFTIWSQQILCYFSLGLHFRHIQIHTMNKLECFLHLPWFFTTIRWKMYSVITLYLRRNILVNCAKIALILPFQSFIHYHMVGAVHIEASLLCFVFSMCGCKMRRITTARYVSL